MFLEKFIKMIFLEILGKFSDCFGRIYESTENLGKMILDKFRKDNSPGNFRQIVGECWECFRFRLW